MPTTIKRIQKLKAMRRAKQEKLRREMEDDDDDDDDDEDDPALTCFRHRRDLYAVHIHKLRQHFSQRVQDGTGHSVTSALKDDSWLGFCPQGAQVSSAGRLRRKSSWT